MQKRHDQWFGRRTHNVKLILHELAQDPKYTRIVACSAIRATSIASGEVNKCILTKRYSSFSLFLTLKKKKK